MKIALLVCDHVREDLVAEHGDYPMMFRRLLPEWSMDDWFVCDGQFPNIDDYDAFICTGSKYSVYDEIKWIEDLTQFTRDVFASEKKFVGVCFGHQMIAHALGGTIQQSAAGYLIGVHSFKVTDQAGWIPETLNSFNIIMLCQDQVIELPTHAKVWAGAGACPVGIFTIGAHFIGIQGHPEFSKAYNQAVFESRPEKISQEKMVQALNSFDRTISKVFFSNLFMKFLNE